MAKESKDFRANLGAHMSKTNRIEVPGQDLLAAEGAARIRIENRRAEEETRSRSGGGFRMPTAWKPDPQEMRDHHIVRVFDRQRGGETGSAKFRKEDMTWPK